MLRPAAASEPVGGEEQGGGISGQLLHQVAQQHRLARAGQALDQRQTVGRHLSSEIVA